MKAQTDAGGTDADVAAATTPTTAQGSGCTTDSATGITLCAGTTECPGVSVNPNAFPGCGFRTVTGTFDLECLCNGVSLCPIGVAESCSQIAGLLSGRTTANICNLVATGACQTVGSGQTAPTGAGGASSTCDPSCAADCANAPSCIEACGC